MLFKAECKLASRHVNTIKMYFSMIVSEVVDDFFHFYYHEEHQRDRASEHHHRMARLAPGHADSLL